MCVLSCILLFVTPWTIVQPGSLSIEFSENAEFSRTLRWVAVFLSPGHSTTEKQKFWSQPLKQQGMLNASSSLIPLLPPPYRVGFTLSHCPEYETLEHLSSV